MMRGRKQEGDEEERLLLLPSTCKVVEYLEPVMSKELVCKFPDNSAFDFDYSQSSIWSPLVPRVHSPLDLDLDFFEPKKLAFGFQEGSEDGEKKGCMALGKVMMRSGAKKKRVGLDAAKMKKMRWKKMKGAGSGSHLSPAPFIAGCAPFASKGWYNILKAASKHFKKKKRDPSSHVKLSNYLRKAGN